MMRKGAGLTADDYLSIFRTGVMPTENVPTPVPSATDEMGFVERQPDPEVPTYRLPHGQAYAEYYRQQEERALLERGAADAADVTTAGDDVGSTVTGLTAGMSQLEVDTYAETLSQLAPAAEQRDTQVYGNYDFSRVDPAAARLPIQARREEIVNKVNAYQVVVLEGRTGCGKTTQVPQYLLDESCRLKKYANIIVTQPRRIAAVSVAKRVAKERNWPLGTLVGYEIGLDRKTGPDTRITYCTTGVLLQKIVHEGNINRYTHVVLDEVHERDTDTDFALLLVRRLLRTTSRHVKVILMSATFNTHMFAQYFAVPVLNRLDPAPIICVGKEEMYDVTVHYLEELMPLLRDGGGDAVPRSEGRSEWDSNSSALPAVNPQLYQLVLRLIKVMNSFDVSDFGPSPRNPRFGAQRGSVLVFLPGMHEIRELAAELEEERHQERWQIMPLHSDITGDEQAAVFQPLQAEQRKIILSTNIAESSITVTDVKYVIDFCMTKQLELDQETTFPMLKLSWASKANCLQRQGRAGRVSSGRVYRLVTKRFYDQLRDYGVPEMLRSPLEHVVLKAKKFCAEFEPKAVLALALEPPQLEKIYTAVLHLKEVGALIDIRGAERFNAFDGELTVLGHIMSTLPVDVNVARLLALGHAYGCLRECLVIAAGLTAKSFFARPFRDELRAYQMKVSWAGKTLSDCLAILAAHKVWEDCKRQGHFQRSGGRGEREWAEKQFIQLRCLQDMETLRQEIERRLETCNMRPLPARNQLESEQERRQQALVLQVCVAGAFYPNYLLRLYREEREQDANRELGGRNPQTTVALTGLPRECGLLYYGQLVRQFRFNPTDPDPIITCENSKAYVEFPVRRRPGDQEHAWEGEIPPAVYLAVRKGQIKTSRVSIMRYSPEEEKQRMEQYMAMCERRRGSAPRGPRPLTMNAPTTEGSTRSDKCRLPGVHLSALPVRVTHVEDPSHFYVQYADPQSIDSCSSVDGRISRLSGLCRPLSGRPQMGRLYLAPYTEHGVTAYFRARVDTVQQRDCQVYFVDYGNTCVVGISELRDFCPELIESGILEVEALAVECTLSEVKPTQAMLGRWDARAVETFKHMALEQMVMGIVYSVVHGVIHIDLVRQVRLGHNVVERSINKELVELGLAEDAVEGHYSRQNHEQRLSSFRVDGRLEEWQERPVAADPELTGWLKQQQAGYDRQVLRGPDSPLTMTLTGLPKALQTRPAFVDTDSCNSVLLDTEPQNPFDRLMVAAQMVPTSDGARVRAQNTAMMPNIPGLPTLLVLLFAPVVELRTNEERTALAGAVCGLGGHPESGQAVYPDHDIEMSFDVAITTRDLLDVNVLRTSFWIVYGCVDDEAAEPQRLRESDRSAAEKQLSRRRRLLALLERRRESRVERRRPYRAAYRWNRLPAGERLQVRLGDEPVDPRLQPFLVSPVRSVNRAERLHMRSRVLELFSKARDSQEAEPHYCPLCDVTVPTPLALFRHINREDHRERAADLYRDCEDGDDDDE
ncbi:ATP-dependent RNA helicase TDRD9 [Amphibalanus amphitrite]|uniref:Probable ATP-dependent RNA helicase spindle-E n=1 Tax=Amphibalanus amphitrite TaxID=1232801 RepID=A0A6A4VWZ3_AMPAM|nr:ATP-dependent RNA helicase TDRD9 [Amphibalanus amphitrite]